MIASNDATDATGAPRNGLPTDPAEIAQALRDARGNISAASTVLGVHRASLHRRIKGDPNLQEVLDETRQVLIDRAEANIFDAVESGCQSASKFVISTVGRGRGWTQRTELATQVDTGRVVVYLPKNGRR